MRVAVEVVNLVLGLCAIGYSFVPPQRVRNYRRGIALLLRFCGMALVAISLIAASLKTLVK